MKLKVKLDPGAKMPTRAHEWDAGLDLYSPKDVFVPCVLRNYGRERSATIDTLEEGEK